MVHQGVILLPVHVSEFVSGGEGKLSLLWASVDRGKSWNRAGLQGRKISRHDSFTYNGIPATPTNI